MTFRNGDRIRVSTVDDDGLPMVRYGTVGAELPRGGPVVVMFDDLLGGDIVDAGDIELVTYESVTLRLDGADLLRFPRLRAGLADMWHAEADLAGLAIPAMFAVRSGDDAGVADGEDSWVLREFTTAAGTFVVRAFIEVSSPDTVVVRADRSNRWDGFFS